MRFVSNRILMGVVGLAAAALLWHNGPAAHRPQPCSPLDVDSPVSINNGPAEITDPAELDAAIATAQAMLDGLRQQKDALTGNLGGKSAPKAATLNIRIPQNYSVSRLGLSHPHGLSSPPADDPLDTIAECAGRCAYPSMCGPKDPTVGTFPARGFAANKFPAPRCQADHATVQDDPYYKHPPAKLELRYAKTRDLIEWGATRAARSGGRGASCLAPERARALNHPQAPGLRGFQGNHPMAWPEEFEFKTKVLLQREPRTYLEWGSGGSTGFYPLLVTGTTDVIDNYPPWCAKVAKEPLVSCMIRENRLNFSCIAPKTSSPLVRMGLAQNDEDNAIVKTSYLQAVVDLGTPHYDVALIDGRFRLACALQLLLTRKVDPSSVVIIHDFWNRIVRPEENYTMVLKYYDVLGGARSAAALQPKPGSVDYTVLARDLASDRSYYF